MNSFVNLPTVRTNSNNKHSITHTYKINSKERYMRCCNTVQNSLVASAVMCYEFLAVFFLFIVYVFVCTLSVPLYLLSLLFIYCLK